ncbi:MAG: sorbitol-6-phosphate dehydrogenase subunit [Phycisphaerales bacterium]|jgi:sorbitol-6-phosphate 2-dehydrogenase
MNWLNLEGKVAIVTGGACGIGRAVCEGLAEVGVSIVVADVNTEAAQKTAEELKAKSGNNCIAVTTDVTNKASVDAVVTETLNAFGRIDVLVNNAGILIPRLLVDPAGKEEITEQIWEKMVSINQKGYFLCAQAVARIMIESGKGGVIINMTSESGLEGSEGQSVYAATKAAIYSLTRSWAKELGKHNIKVVGIAPGIVEATDLRSEDYERAVAYTRGITIEQLREKYKTAAIPLGRSCKLTEIADTVCFLASERSSYIHGTVINVSGGKSRA